MISPSHFLSLILERSRKEQQVCAAAENLALVYIGANFFLVIRAVLIVF
jgi:hypothetical protein